MVSISKQEYLDRWKLAQYEIMTRVEGKPLEELVSETPTTWLWVLNAAHDSGVCGDLMEALFGKFNGFERLEMFMGSRPYSLVHYETAEDALNVYKGLDGRNIEIWNDRTVLLAFAKSIPTFPPRPLMTMEDIKATGISGLNLILEFVTKEAEEKLLESIAREGDNGRWEMLAKRRVQHYGFRFDYPSKQVDRNAIEDPQSDTLLPSWTAEVLQKYHKLFPDAIIPDQLTMNHYMPGGGIAPHTDRHSSFLGPILVLSLGHGLLMEFRSNSLKARHNVFLAPRSLLIIDGEARYGWEHAIRPRKMDLIDGKAIVRQPRWSLTFRTVRKPSDPQCDCRWRQMCD